MAFQPKPHQNAFDRFNTAFNINPAKAVFFEDLSRNLEPAHAMGYATVLVHSDKDWSHEPEGARPAGPYDHKPPYVDFAINDLTGFLQRLI